MRIVYMLGEDINRTGSGIVHFLAIANSLKRLGHDVCILGPRYHRHLKRPAGLKSVFIPVPGRNPFSFLLFYVLAAVSMPFIAWAHRPAALLARGGMGLGFLVYLAARLMGIRVVLEVNGLSWLELSVRGFAAWQAALAKLNMFLECRTAQRLIAVSPTVGSELVRCCGVSAKRVFVVQNGADPDEFDRGNRAVIRANLGIAPDKFVVGFIGDFSPWHGAREIAESAGRLSPATRAQVLFVLVGDGERWRETREYVTQASLEGTVRMPGRATRKEVADYLAVFDVGVYLIRLALGVSPLKFWEYIASGLPVIVSDNANLTPIVRNENMGLVIREASPACLAEAIQEAWRRRDEFQEIGRRNRELAIRKYSWLAAARAVADVLDNAPGGPTTPLLEAT